MQDCGGMFQLAILADRGGLAVALRRRRLDAQRLDRALAEQLAELLADIDELGQILDIAAGEGIGDDRDRGGATCRRIDRALCLALRLFDDGDDLANLCTHLSPLRGYGMVQQRES